VPRPPPKEKERARLGVCKHSALAHAHKERAANGKISPATLRNYIKAVKLFCEMKDIVITWKKITRGLPRARRFADDRAPTPDEILRIVEYPDRRIKAHYLHNVIIGNASRSMDLFELEP